VRAAVTHPPDRDLGQFGRATMTELDSRLPARWQNRLAERYDLESLYRNIDDLYRNGLGPIFPEQSAVFRAFLLTPPEDVRVVILGQDPYPRPKEADGLAFSMANAERPVPRSLRAIFTNIASDPALANDRRSFVDPGHGDLTEWATRGVLLLNSALTVGERAGSHKRHWRGFARAVLDAIVEMGEPTVFLLWGGPAIRAARQLRMTDDRHKLSCSAHPAAWDPGQLTPFAAVPHFSMANQHLGDRAIDWSLSSRQNS
jgi:uracil-DNA glycosylase